MRKVCCVIFFFLRESLKNDLGTDLGRNLATCIWESRSLARAAGNTKDHAIAMRLIKVRWKFLELKH
jgi:hypothetical protein